METNFEDAMDNKTFKRNPNAKPIKMILPVCDAMERLQTAVTALQRGYNADEETMAELLNEVRGSCAQVEQTAEDYKRHFWIIP
jgi:hypothetical protein